MERNFIGEANLGFARYYSAEYIDQVNYCSGHNGAAGVLPTALQLECFRSYLYGEGVHHRNDHRQLDKPIHVIHEFEENTLRRLFTYSLIFVYLLERKDSQIMLHLYKLPALNL